MMQEDWFHGFWQPEKNFLNCSYLTGPVVLRLADC